MDIAEWPEGKLLILVSWKKECGGAPANGGRERQNKKMKKTEEINENFRTAVILSRTNYLELVFLQI